MNKLFKLIYSIISRFSGNHNNQAYIRNNQYYDKYGMLHMKRYLDYLDGCDGYNSYGSSVFENADFGLSEFPNSQIFKELSGPRYDSKIIEELYGPTTYIGGLEHYKVEEGISKIGNWAFAYNLNLTEIHLPFSLKKLGNNVFTMCLKLKTISIPANVVKIGKEAFDSNLENLYLYAEHPPKINILGISNKCNIFIPQKHLHLYLNNPEWRRYNKQMIPI